jgi:hypothetical protein
VSSVIRFEEGKFRGGQRAERRALEPRVSKESQGIGFRVKGHVRRDKLGLQFLGFNVGARVESLDGTDAGWQNPGFVLQNCSVRLKS